MSSFCIEKWWLGENQWERGMKQHDSLTSHLPISPSNWQFNTFECLSLDCLVTKPVAPLLLWSAIPNSHDCLSASSSHRSSQMPNLLLPFFSFSRLSIFNHPTNCPLYLPFFLSLTPHPCLSLSLFLSHWYIGSASIFGVLWWQLLSEERGCVFVQKDVEHHGKVPGKKRSSISIPSSLQHGKTGTELFPVAKPSSRNVSTGYKTRILFSNQSTQRINLWQKSQH